MSAVTVQGGKIADISPTLPTSPRYPVLDYKYAVISPGVIDVHAHLNEPGREEWEGEGGGGRGFAMLRQAKTHRDNGRKALHLISNARKFCWGKPQLCSLSKTLYDTSAASFMCTACNELQRIFVTSVVDACTAAEDVLIMQPVV